MILFLLRHADAESHAASDAARKLTEKGRDQARKAGAFCREHELVPAVIVTSPFRRAQETARLAAAEMEKVEVVTEPFLSSGMSPDEAFAGLASFKKFDPLMIVGHEPDFSNLAAALVGLRTGEHIVIKKSSLTAIECDDARAGMGRLLFSIPASLM